MCVLISFFKKKARSKNPFSFMAALCFFILLYSQSDLFAQSSPSVPQTIIIGGDFYYPPYEFLDDQGFPTGYTVELTQAIATVMGIKVEIRLGSWDKMRKALETGEIDALQGMVFTPERKEKYDFTPPHAIIHQSIFYRKGSIKAQEIESLKGKEVIVQKGGSIHDTFLKMGMDDKLVLTDTHASALRLLASGKHDYAVVANLPGLYLGKKLHLSNIVMSGKPIKSFRYCYAVKKGNIELLALLNEGLSILKNTGQHQQIYDKWLGVYEPKEIPWKLIVKTALIVIIPLILIMVGIVFWNRTLKKEVSIRTNEIHQQQQQLIQADKMSTLGILVSGVAHEINNPNSLVLLNTPIIKDAFEDLSPILEAHYIKNGNFLIAGLEYSRMKEELPLMISEMLAGGKRIKRIVEDLKDFARIEHSKDMEIININQVVKTSIRLVDNSIKKATDNFHDSYTENIEKICANPQRIEQVIVNLILNACQALDNKKNGVYIRTYLSRNKKFVMVEVKDEGKGIKPENLIHLTDPFFTTKRGSGGTGLGLSVSANIVKEHNGTMTFSSNVGGTIALLSLPIQGG